MCEKLRISSKLLELRTRDVTKYHLPNCYLAHLVYKIRVDIQKNLIIFLKPTTDGKAVVALIIIFCMLLYHYTLMGRFGKGKNLVALHL